MQIKVDNDFINVNHKLPTKEILRHAASLMLLFLFIVFGVFNFIDENQKIYINCNKKENICTIKTKKFFSPAKKRCIIYDKTKEAVLYGSGCGRGPCTYSIHIPYYNSYIEIYSSTENKDVANAIVENFNKYRSSDINEFKIEVRLKHLFIGTISVVTLGFLIVFLYLLFLYPIKTTIIINKKDRKLNIINKPIFGVINGSIDFSKLAKVKIRKVGETWQIYYIDPLKNNKTFPIIILFDEKEARQIYELLSQEHKSALESKNDNDSEV